MLEPGNEARSNVESCFGPRLTSPQELPKPAKCPVSAAIKTVWSELHHGLREEAEKMLQRQEVLLEAYLGGLGSLPELDLVDGPVTWVPGTYQDNADAAEASNFSQTAYADKAVPQAEGSQVDGASMPAEIKEATCTATLEATILGRSAITSQLSRQGLGEMEILEAQRFHGILGRRLGRIVHQCTQIKEPERTGAFARFVDSRAVELATMFVIVLNGITIIVATNRTMPSSAGQSMEQSVEQSGLEASLELVFLLYYTLELLCNVLVHRCYFFVNQDAAWNVMDLVLVTTGVADYVLMSVYKEEVVGNASFMRILRVLRVSRIVRMLRTLKFIAELRLMLACLLGSVIPLVWVATLIMFLLVIFSIFFVQGFTFFVYDEGASQPQGVLDEVLARFGSVEQGALTLFQDIAGGNDWRFDYELISKLGPIHAATFMFFMTFFIIAVWNVVTSIFLDKAMRLATPDLECVMLESNRKNLSDAKELVKLLHDSNVDANKDGLLSYDELQSLWQHPIFKLFFEVRAIDIKDLDMFYMMLTKSSGVDCVPLDTFVEGCIGLKGTASSIDLHTVRFEIQEMHKVMTQLRSKIDALGEATLPKRYSGRKLSTGLGNGSSHRLLQHSGAADTSMLSL